jgi:hypothetical protein
MESDPILMNDHSWYDMTREEQQECLMKKARRIYEIDRERFYHNYEVTEKQWFYMMFKGIVSIYLMTLHFSSH